MKEKIELGSYQIDKHNWFYADKKGITLIHEDYAKDEFYIATRKIRLTWRKLDQTRLRVIKKETLRGATGED